MQIGTGMNDVSLQTFLMQQPKLLEVVFPPHAAKQIKLLEFLAKVSYENEKEDSDKQARAMFEQYLHEIAQRKEGIYLCLLRPLSLINTSRYFLSTFSPLFAKSLDKPVKIFFFIIQGNYT